MMSSLINSLTQQSFDVNDFLAINVFDRTSLTLKTIVYISSPAELLTIIAKQQLGLPLAEQLYKLTDCGNTEGLRYIFCSQEFIARLFTREDSDELLDHIHITRPSPLDYDLLSEAISVAYINENGGTNVN